MHHLYGHVVQARPALPFCLLMRQHETYVRWCIDVAPLHTVSYVIGREKTFLFSVCLCPDWVPPESRINAHKFMRT